LASGAGAYLHLSNTIVTHAERDSLGNGGNSEELALSPLWFQLFDVNSAIARATDDFYRAEFPEIFFFGGNGGCALLSDEGVERRQQRRSNS
jgi:hypothetical protein